MNEFLAQFRSSLAGTSYKEPQDKIYKTDRIKGAVPTNKWWSSALWKPFSSAMYPHPMAVKAYEEGIGVAHPEVTVDKNTHIDNKKFINGLYEDDKKDFIIGCQDNKFDEALVDGHGDWTVNLLFQSNKSASKMRATLGLGNAYLYLTNINSKTVLKSNGKMSVWHGKEASNVVGIEINGNSYGVFIPTGCSWELLDETTIRFYLTSEKDYMSIALLPNQSIETLQYFQQYAYAFIVDSKVNWSYDETDGSVLTTYTVVTERKEGSNEQTLMSLYPHQWRNTSVEFTPYSYHSPRGVMKVFKGQAFQTELVYRGMLPFLPQVDVDQKRLQGYIDQVLTDKPLMKGNVHGTGTYWVGKNFGKLSQLIPIAFQQGDQQAVKELTDAIVKELEEWFDNDELKDEKFLYYNQNWRTIIGYPSGFGADTDLNDHHFHYGYFVYAAAMVLLFSNESLSENMKKSIELLIKDFANSDREEMKFPFLRNFEPYAGHSWASGNAMDLMDHEGNVVAEPGNNQESSSEAVNAWASLILWGEATGNQTIRNTGIYLYTTEIESIFHYWFDVHDETMPDEYHYKYAPMVFSSGVEYRTWWTLGVEEIHMINMMPITGASLYLGFYPEYAQFNYDTMVKEIGGIETKARDIIWSYQALHHPKEAMRKFDSLDYEPDFGESKAHTYHWIKNLCSLGQVESSFTANTALSSVFNQDGKRIFVAYNAKDEPITVIFFNSDQKQFTKWLLSLIL